MKRYAIGAVFGAILGASGFAIAGYPHYPQANNAGIMPGGRHIVSCLDRATGVVRPGAAGAPAAAIMRYSTGDGAWWNAQTLTCP